jgi:hypothetical protein
MFFCVNDLRERRLIMYAFKSDIESPKGIYGKAEKITRVTSLGTEYTTVIGSLNSDEEDVDYDNNNNTQGGVALTIDRQTNDVKEREKKGRKKHVPIEYEDMFRDIDVSQIQLSAEQINGMNQHIARIIIPNTNKVYVRDRTSSFNSIEEKANKLVKESSARLDFNNNNNNNTNTIRDTSIKKQRASDNEKRAVRFQQDTETTPDSSSKLTSIYQFSTATLGDFIPPKTITGIPRDAFINPYHYLPPEFVKKIENTMYCLEVILRYQPKLNRPPTYTKSLEAYRREGEEAGMYYAGLRVVSPDYAIMDFKFMEPPPPPKPGEYDSENEEDQDYDTIAIAKRNDIYGEQTEEELMSCMEDRLQLHVILDDPTHIPNPMQTELDKAKRIFIESKTLRFRTAFFSLL